MLSITHTMFVDLNDNFASQDSQSLYKTAKKKMFVLVKELSQGDGHVGVDEVYSVR